MLRLKIPGAKHKVAFDTNALKDKSFLTRVIKLSKTVVYSLVTQVGIS